MRHNKLSGVKREPDKKYRHRFPGVSAGFGNADMSCFVGSQCTAACRCRRGTQCRIYFLPAWTNVTAAVMTMSYTEHPLERSLIGIAKPWRKGPYASAPARRCTSL